MHLMHSHDVSCDSLLFIPFGCFFLAFCLQYFPTFLTPLNACMQHFRVNENTQQSGTAETSNTAVHGIIGKVQEAFPGALPSHRMAKQAARLLEKHGYKDTNTLLSTSLCSDEVNRDIEDEMRQYFGNSYAIGGLAGFPFGGVVGFGNMAHHIPIGGHGLVFFGPHVGFDFDQTIGKVNRRGHQGSSECCGPALAALEYCRRVKAGELGEIGTPEDITESQQTWVCHELLPMTDRIIKEDGEEAQNIQLPTSMYEAQDAMMGRILAKAGGEIREDSKIAFLGGITVNTPEGNAEYFLPKKFVVMDNKGAIVDDLLDELLSVKAVVPSRMTKMGGSLSGAGHKTYG